MWLGIQNKLHCYYINIKQQPQTQFVTWWQKMVTCEPEKNLVKKVLYHFKNVS